MSYEVLDKWGGHNISGRRYGDDDIAYEKAIAFLDQPGYVLEDWGCGGAWAKRFVKHATYIGVDGSGTQLNVKADLRTYRSSPDAILMRAVLEHNMDWRSIMENAMQSFTKRFCLAIFTPFQDIERILDDHSSFLPDIGLVESELVAFFKDLKYTKEEVKTATKYGLETLYYIER